ncbi:DUF1801 domain-containing protein [bacterium]|nr:DUF1801 domain-containing protein [bacterium]
MHPDVAAYHAGFEGEIRLRLDKLHQCLVDWHPDAEHCLRYGIPTFRVRGRNRVHYAAFAKHLGLYPGPEALRALAPQLAGWKHSKGAVQFPHHQPLPWSLIEDLVRWEPRGADE